MGRAFSAMDENIKIGKYTLESLTTGMYSDPKIIYREYIQNSVDALEMALQAGLLEPQDVRIDIVVDAENAYISIRDNGTGINSKSAVSTLLNIGSSQKRHSNNRGFRGIGRLGGMSYCGRLVFTTSAENETTKTIVEFDCKKLKQLLVGSITEQTISGIRVRKGNILIGDNRTLNEIFKESRFNGWTQGELFVITDKLIPNARRDDFEQNEAYYELIKALKEGVGGEITKAIREASAKRNDISMKVINEVEQQVNDATVAVAEGFNSSVDKKRLLNQLEAAEESLKKTKIRDDLKPQVEEVKQKLVQKIEEVNGSSNYKINQVTNSIDKRSKRILAIVSDILSEKLSKPLVDDIIEEIVTVLNGKKV